MAGVLSGTSADGIDVAVGRVALGDGPRVAGIEPVRCETVPMEASLAGRVRGGIDGDGLSFAELATLDRDLGLAFGGAARAVAARAGAGPLALVASHGQTVFHHDGDPDLGRVTLQLGDGDHVAEAAGCAVASDFRTRDCAAGGEGAPLVVLVDEVLFGAGPRPLAVLNLGGIANWTVLRSDGPPLGADAGPAGALLDGLARALLGRPMDEDGRAAARGTPSEPALERLTERERTILTLRFFKSMSQSEIARQVGISQMHVSRLLTRILETLRSEVVDDDDENSRPGSQADSERAATKGRGTPRGFTA